MLLVAYNQEKFIAEALQGVLNQTYSPLEIIVSDDASVDSTFEVISSISSSYSGPHELRIMKSERNSGGLIAHLNAIMPAVKGALVIINAGDDISKPDRVEDCYQAWIASKKSSLSIWSDYQIIAENGDLIDHGCPRRLESSSLKFRHLSISPLDIAGWRIPIAFGCTQAWSPEIFTKLGPLPVIQDLVNEDSAIFFRAALISGRASKINSACVLYRRHSTNCSSGVAVETECFQNRSQDNIATRVRTLKRLMAVCNCFLYDLSNAMRLGIYTDSDGALRKEIVRSLQSYTARLNIATSESRLAAFRILVWILLFGRGRKYAVRQMFTLLFPNRPGAKLES